MTEEKQEDRIVVTVSMKWGSEGLPTDKVEAHVREIERAFQTFINKYNIHEGSFFFDVKIEGNEAAGVTMSIEQLPPRTL